VIPRNDRGDRELSSSFTRFDPLKRQVYTEQLTERLQRTQKACSDVHQTLIPNKTTDRNEIELSLLKQRYPEHYREELLTLARIKLPKAGLFVIDEHNTVEKDFKTREALVYSVMSTVYHPDNPNIQQLGHAKMVRGWFQKPEVLFQYSDDGLHNLIRADVKSWTNQYYIPFSKEKVQELIDEHDGNYKSLVLATTSATGGETWHDGSAPLKIPNLEEFKTVEFLTLVAANSAGVLTAEYGGHMRYLKDAEAKRKKIDEEVAEYIRKKST
jgi:hypothetical protein